MSSPQPMAASLMGPPPYAPVPDGPAHDPCERPASGRQPSPPSARDVTPKLQTASHAGVDQLPSASQQAVPGLSDDYKTQTDRERQNAASALLAQILAGQQGQLSLNKDDKTGTPSQDEMKQHVLTEPQLLSNNDNNITQQVNNVSMDLDNPQEQEQLQSVDIAPPHSPILPVNSNAEPHQLDEDEDATDRVLKDAWDMSEPHQPPTSSANDYLQLQQPGNSENIDTTNGTSLPENHDLILHALADGQTKLEPDLNLTQLYSNIAAFTTPKTAKEALTQHDLLTAAYFATTTNMNAGPTPRIVGYPELPTPSEAERSQNGAESVATSEPRISAFAKLEFDDGHFYVNTYSFILGRDVRAARAALQRDIQVKQANRSQGPGSVAATPNKVKPEGDIMGSVISEKGGIMGFDPDVSHNGPPQVSWKSSNNSSSSNQHVHPMLHMSHGEQSNEVTEKKDYNALAMQSLQRKNEPKKVDTLTLLPSPESCPTIPIHPPIPDDGAVSSHRSISRKHVKIAYNFNKNLFEMHVLGRNGAFKGADWLAPGQVRPLHSGDYIQIGGVRVRFLLPDVPIGETGADREEEPSPPPEKPQDVPVQTTEEVVKPEKPKRTKEPAKKAEKPRESSAESKTTESKKPSASAAPETGKPVFDANGNPIAVPPVKRRGPGRPPKDGIMSKRERAEIAREQKLAAKREANGGVTPPPTSRPKGGKKEGESEDPAKQEKRKYTKRKKPDSAGPGDVVVPSVEGAEGSVEPKVERSPRPPPPKKRKPSRSPSPDYPPESFYTPKELQKPPYNYAVLIFDALSESPTPMTLKQIYRALKLKYPYFRFKCETEGWTSSVRHNLNGNAHLFMHAERDGKGWSWKIIPGASVDKEKKRRPSPPPLPEPPSIPRPQYMPPQTNPPGYLMPQPGHPNQQYTYPPPPPSQQPMNSNPYTMPPPPHPSAQPTPTPYPPQPQEPPKKFSLPETLRKTLPIPFTPSANPTYRSPYPGASPAYTSRFGLPAQPQVPQQYHPQRQFQHPPQPYQHPPPPPYQQHPPPPQHHPPHHPQPRPAQPHTQPPTTFTFQARPQPVPNHNPPPPPPPANANQGPPLPPPVQPAPPQPMPPPPPQQQHAPAPQPPQSQMQPPNQNQPQPQQQQRQQSSASDPGFMERANQAIDNFEAVLIEDYEDKEYIRKVLRSARDRVLNGAKESSFPGGEPPDEAVIIDALKGIIGQLNDEEE